MNEQVLMEIRRRIRREYADLSSFQILFDAKDLLAEVDRLREYLREKNEIIKAFAGPRNMTPEDVAYALDDRQRLLVLLDEIRAEKIER